MMYILQQDSHGRCMMPRKGKIANDVHSYVQNLHPYYNLVFWEFQLNLKKNKHVRQIGFINCSGKEQHF